MFFSIKGRSYWKDAFQVFLICAFCAKIRRRSVTIREFLRPRKNLILFAFTYSEKQAKIWTKKLLRELFLGKSEKLGQLLFQRP